MPDPILLRLISICINWLRINIIINIIIINIIIIAIVGIGTACSLAMHFLLSLPPFSNTPEEHIISIATGASVSTGLITARFKYFKS